MSWAIQHWHIHTRHEQKKKEISSKKTWILCSFFDKSNIHRSLMSIYVCVWGKSEEWEKPKNVLQFTEKELNCWLDGDRPNENVKRRQDAPILLMCLCVCVRLWCSPNIYDKRNSQQNKLPNQFNNRTKWESVWRELWVWMLHSILSLYLSLFFPSSPSIFGFHQNVV